MATSVDKGGESTASGQRWVDAMVTDFADTSLQPDQVGVTRTLTETVTDGENDRSHIVGRAEIDHRHRR